MKSSETAIARTTGQHEPQIHSAKFTKVENGRKQPIRGLWQRNARFYAQLTFEDAHSGEKQTRRVPLLDKEQQPVATAAPAVEAMNRLKVKRSPSRPAPNVSSIGSISVPPST